MNPEKCSVSIVIPTFNGIANLAYVLDSIERQTRVRNISQIIIVDDASTLRRKREKYERLENDYPQLPIEVIYLESNRGPATARNVGIQQATGDIVFFTDDDCDLPANTLEQHLAVYRDRPQVSGVGGWYQSLSHIVQESIYERFLLASYLTFHGLQLYQRSSISSEYYSQPELFSASNTAHLSVKRYVFHDVLFDEDFVAPGIEDPFFSEEVRKKGYLLEYIPLFVVHRKNLNRKKFFKRCYNRGIGLFVARKKYGKKPQMNFFSGLRWFNDKLGQLSKEYPEMGKYRYRLLLLEGIRRLYQSRVMDMYFSIKYFLKRGYIPSRKY